MESGGGALIAFTDDDCIPEPDWLDTRHGSLLPRYSGRVRAHRRSRGRRPTDYELNTSFLEHAEFATANCFYRREALVEAGGFDERFTTAGGRTPTFSSRCSAATSRLINIRRRRRRPPRAGRGSWGISIREQSKSMFNALLFKKHPDLYQERIKQPGALRYYLIVASAHAAFLSALVAGLRLARRSRALRSCWPLAHVSLCATRLSGTSRSPGHFLEMIVTSLVIPFHSFFWRLAGAVRFKVMLLHCSASHAESVIRKTLPHEDPGQPELFLEGGRRRSGLDQRL